MEMSNYALFQTRSGLFVNRTARALLFEVSKYWRFFLHNGQYGQNDFNFRDQETLFLMLGPCLRRRAESPWTSIGNKNIDILKLCHCHRFGWFYKRNGTTWSDGRVLNNTWRQSDDSNVLGDNGNGEQELQWGGRYQEVERQEQVKRQSWWHQTTSVIINLLAAF